jgi:hypothetical protein
LLTPFAVAVITTVVVDDTCVVCNVKVWVFDPAGIVMLVTVGAATVELLLIRETTILPGAAGRSRVTVPVTSLPPVTGFGLSVSESTPMGRTNIVTFLKMPLAVAVNGPLWVAATGVVVSWKVWLIAPARTVILAGVVVAVRLSVSVTVMLPGLAAHSSVTLPEAASPPMIRVGITDTDDTPMGLTVRAALLVTVPVWPVTVPVWVAETGTVVIVKVWEVAPAGIVTLDGSVVDASVSLSVTTIPLAGAGALIVTVPVTPLHPATALGLSTSDEMVGGDAAWVTVKVFPAMVSVPVRAVVTMLAATL